MARVMQRWENCVPQSMLDIDNCVMQYICDMETIAEIIEAWPNPETLASQIKTTPGLIAVWKHRGSIPSEYWRAIADAARKQGIDNVTIDLLVDLAARRRNQTSAA